VTNGLSLQKHLRKINFKILTEANEMVQ